MLADIRCGDEDLCERNRVVWEEVECQIVLRVGVGIDDPCDVDNEADCLNVHQSITEFKTVVRQTNFAM